MGSAAEDAARGRGVARELVYGNTALVAGLLVGNGPEAWIAFDREVRRLQRFPGVSTGRLEARLCHPDGRIRAKALAAWRNPPAELVLIRCADWAPQVRERARRVLGRVLAHHPVRTRDRARRALNRPVADDPALVLAALTPLTLRLGGREHGGWAVDQLEAALAGRYSSLAAWWRPGLPSTTWSWNSLTPGQRAGMLERLGRSTDLPTRRFAARVALAAGRYGAQELALRAAAEPDPAAGRLWTDAALAAMAADGPDDAVVDALLASRFPPVRAAGVTALRRAGRAAEAERFLADRAGSVRACARWLLRQDGGDPYARYRALLADPERVSGYAVAGFTEVAGPDDVPVLRGLLEHRDGTVRAAALAGLRRFGAEVADPVLLALLEGPSASAAREAALHLMPVARRLDAAALAARTGREWRPHTRRAAFRLLQGRGGSAELRASVALLDHPDPGTRRCARQRVAGWNWLATLDEGAAAQAELGGLLARAADLLGALELRLAHAPGDLPGRAPRP
ncbi:HEAT repeat domain-containing protein [Streptomyces racemochromogenes]|uniref:HEAT repeat domain-containing protein n=1 Tax=Streptomyces racemochromogenes TaxID=67353 RepID=A0ABW7PI09_9ACTN